MPWKRQWCWDGQVLLWPPSIPRVRTVRIPGVKRLVCEPLTLASLPLLVHAGQTDENLQSNIHGVPVLRKRPRASPCKVQTGSWYQECFCDNSLVTPQGPQKRGSQCLTTKGNKIEPVPVIQLNRCWYFHANEDKFFGYTLISFVAHLIIVSALGLQTGCVNLNCWGWSWTLLLPRASADWSQAIPTDSVIHRQGILTPPLHFPLRIPQSRLISSYQLQRY